MGEQAPIGILTIIVFGVGSQWLAWITRLPGILLLLIAGIIAGPVTGLVHPDLLMGELLTPFISVSVGVILFEGGLSLNYSELQEVGGDITKLISIGVITTLSLVSFSAYYLFDFGIELSVLLGSILIVTGPTVVIPLLRQVRPTSQVSNVLKWEGIVIDPIGAMMAVLVFELIKTGSFSHPTSLAFFSILKTIFFGTVTGLAGAGLIFILLRRYLLPDFLQNPVTLMIVVLVFGVSDFLMLESGLWATTVMGIALANQKSARIYHIVEFKENLRVLLLSALFILLAARVELAELKSVLTWEVLAFLVFLVFIARPLSVYLSTIGSKLSSEEKLFVSWMAPRGVVAASIASLFALELTTHGYEQASQIVPIVFMVIISTVAIYGLTAGPVAKWLGVAKASPSGFLIIGAHSWARKLGMLLKNEGVKILMVDSNRANINRAKQLGLDTYYGNILAEYALEEIDLDGIGKLLSLTPNDEVNALAVIRFRDIFSYSSVFQLPTSAMNETRSQEVPENLSGRTLFEKDFNYTKLVNLENKGAKLQVAQINGNRDELLSNSSVYPIILITEMKEAVPYTVDYKPEPKPGSTLIYMKVPEESEE